MRLGFMQEAQFQLPVNPKAQFLSQVGIKTPGTKAYFCGVSSTYDYGFELLLLALKQNWISLLFLLRL